LKNASIDRPQHEVLAKISSCERFLDLGCLSEDDAVNLYRSFKELIGTQTKSVISVLSGLRINGPVFSDYPFILSAKEDGVPKMVKIVRVADGGLDMAVRLQDLANEIKAAEIFIHDAIVPMRHIRIEIDTETAGIAGCRSGSNSLLVMPWYLGTVNIFPSAELPWIAVEGFRLISAVDFIHSRGYAHLDIKSLNVFVSGNAQWFLGDFGACKRFGEKITASSFQFCFENNLSNAASPVYDWFMLLVMVLIESLVDRRSYTRLFYPSSEASFADYNLVVRYAESLVADNESQFGALVSELLQRLRMCN
jgi:serine/threonine protein kinase